MNRFPLQNANTLSNKTGYDSLYLCPVGVITTDPMAQSMADVNQSFLDKKPTLDELCEYIVIGVKWYQLGIQLKLNVKLLCAIDEQPREITYKTSKMFELWLDTNPHASRRHIVDALRKEVIGETSLADYYVKTLMESACK